MNRPIRVLIVDDSSMVRRMLTQVLSQEEGIEVVGHAIDGEFAVQKIRELKPDLLTLDIEMPGLNGLQTLDKLREERIRLPVIMFSTLTDRGAASTLDALAKGAMDYVCKPSNHGNVEQVVASIHRELVPKIKTAVGRKMGASVPGLTTIPKRGRLYSMPKNPDASAVKPSSSKPADSAKKEVTPSSGEVLEAKPAGRVKPVSAKLDILTIGISTGGPNALNEFLPQIPKTFPVPILIVQHMPPVFTRLLAERLDAKCELEVAEARGGEHPKAGQVFIAPGDYHMVIEGTRGGFSLALNQNPPENSCRPAVDPMLSSASRTFGPRMLSLIMTGMGSDGFKGCKEVLDNGGEVWAQDEASSVVWGMPGFVANAGLVDKIVPLGALARELAARFPMRGAARTLVGKH